MLAIDCSELTYGSRANEDLLLLLRLQPIGKVLDCGCGCGGNAAALSQRGWNVTGITLSEQEAQQARRFCDSVYVANLEQGLPDRISDRFDLLVFSHVLEHLSDPTSLLASAVSCITSRGAVLVALPNVLYWKNRLNMLFGKFTYESGGIMDSTHLRFYTIRTAKLLIEQAGYQIEAASITGHFPLGPIRKVLPKVSIILDKAACALLPGLFAWQSLYLATPTRTKGIEL